MKINDFSIPRRMSKSAFVIYFVKALRNYASIILILFTVRIFDSSEETSIMEYIIMLLSYLAGFLVISLITAFLSFYFKKYYVLSMVSYSMKGQASLCIRSSLYEPKAVSFIVYLT